MRKHGLMTCVLLVTGLLAFPALADEARLVDQARARWEAYASEAPEALAKALHPTGGTVFMGTPWDGFYYSEASEEAWSSLQAWITPEELQIVSERVLPDGNLVWAELTLSGTLRDVEEPVTVRMASALVFDADGLLLAEDLIVLDGLNADSPAPAWEETIDEQAYTHHVRESATGIDLWWRNGLVVLLAGVRAPGTGWVSVGFDPQRMMLGADFIIGALTGAGLTVEDHHGHLPTGHRRDGHEDILAAGGEIAEGTGALQFVIPLHSGDPQDNSLVPGESYTMLLAYHRSSTSFAVRHTARGSTSITLDD